MKKQNYLFLGSSITYGAGSGGIGIAEMFSEDYAKVEYNEDRNGEKIRGIKYLRRLTKPEGNNLDGWQGLYRCDDISIVINGDGTGTFKDFPIHYSLEENKGLFDSFAGYSDFKVHFYSGDNVYKTACNGYKLAYPVHDPATWTTSYCYLLEEMIYKNKLITSTPDDKGNQVKDYDGRKIDQVFIQLSTNDAGQENTVFGDINDEETDYTTSYGAIRYLVKLCKDTWGEECKVTYYVCPRCDMEGNYGIRYARLRDGLLALRDKYQNFEILDMWSNDEVTHLVRGRDYLKYLLEDKVHPTENGYERIFFQEFRKYVESK